MTKIENDSESLLLECIDRIMPIALQIALEKNQEPTYKNVLHVIATHGHEWFLTLTATGNFVQLSAGWMFVRQTNTVITDNSAMDEAVLHSLRNLSSFGKGVELADLCSYISAAFKFPTALSPGEINEKVQCSSNSMKAWGRVDIDNGRYKLPAEVLTAGGRDISDTAVVAKVEPSQPAISNSSSPSSTLSVDVKREPDVAPHVLSPLSPETKLQNLVVSKNIPGPETTPGKRVNRSAKTNSAENNSEKLESVVEFDQVSITSANSPQPNTSVERPRSPVREYSGPVPFLYASGRYKVFLSYIPRTNRKPNLGTTGGVVRTLLQEYDLAYSTVYVPPSRPSMAFVEVQTVDEGMKVIEKLNGSLQDRGAFNLRAEWALPNERDHTDIQYAKWQKQQQRPSRSPSKAQDAHPRASTSATRGPRTPDRSASPRTKRRRSRTRSPRRPSRLPTPVNVDRRRGRSTSPVRQRTKRLATRSPSPGDEYRHYSPSPLNSGRSYADRPDARGDRGGSPGRYHNDVPPIDRSACEGGSSYRAEWPEATWNHSERISEPYRSPERRNNWESRQYSQTEYRTNEKAHYNKTYR